MCGKIPWKSSKLEDDEWMKKLKCLDDIHSHENGLTQQSVDCLLCKVELQLDPLPFICPTNDVTRFIKHHTAMMQSYCKHAKIKEILWWLNAMQPCSAWSI
ncbi:hypothetical protein NQ317_001958 [Molorchus minor]|uniref:Uncharacterized protein n=1 Tax=Molorchus minor TaxID=1323400 RepID=A0ABQ9J9M3_9CUCU|nr:hypothetical protein NQ317_001958 [Molorchus minor]